MTQIYIEKLTSQERMIDPRCIKCNVQLVPELNWYPVFKEQKNYICKNCHNTIQRKIQWKNPDKIRTCRKCNVILHVGINFLESNKKHSHYWCNNCAKQYHNDRYVYNQKTKQYRLKYALQRYNLTHEQYQSMIIQQENRCAICGNEFIKAPCVDEDHNNQNRIRGLLCEKCNHGLGQFKDSIAYLQNAINYLSR